MTGKQRSITTRIAMGASHLGIERQEYARRVADGLRWCSGHKDFEPHTLFGPHAGRADGIDTQCQEASRERARINMARLYAERRSTRLAEREAAL